MVFLTFHTISPTTESLPNGIPKGRGVAGDNEMVNYRNELTRDNSRGKTNVELGIFANQETK